MKAIIIIISNIIGTTSFDSHSGSLSLTADNTYRRTDTACYYSSSSRNDSNNTSLIHSKNSFQLVHSIILQTTYIRDNVPAIIIVMG
ncbi:MAG: hypothetical protein L6V87_02085 [Ruminococcus sp.]|nr:MAG: hypothetical protein L6V87_02085 [Ruminococcus sp.]